MQLAETFYLVVFVFLSQGLLDHSFVNHCRSGLFLYITDLSVSKQSNSFELETLEAKCNLLNNFLTKKDLPPHRHLRIVANSLFIYSWQRLLFSSIGYTWKQSSWRISQTQLRNDCGMTSRMDVNFVMYCYWKQQDLTDFYLAWLSFCHIHNYRDRNLREKIQW
jgi:hypothetical protein